MIRTGVLIICLLCGSAAQAQDIPVRPVARSVADAAVAPRVMRPLARRSAVSLPVREQAQIAAAPLAQTAGVAAPKSMRPALRPYEKPLLARGATTKSEVRAEQNLFAFSPNAPAFSLRPTPRSVAFVQAMTAKQVSIQRGQVCGDPAIQGEIIGAVAGRGACGIDDAVRIKSVAGVQIRPQATVDCRTAQALKSWITTGAQPATNNQATSLRVVSHYACRNRNAAASGRLSEHAFGRAIDIAGIGLKDGREITVLTGWNTKRDGETLRRMWQAACGPFGTVLGPNANRFHRDHFHFDTARYRSGSYCR